MIKIEHTDVYGWEAVIRGMRNPMNSWDKSDSFNSDSGYEIYKLHKGEPEIGENDLDLMKRLSKAGNDHGKFLRYIDVTCDITAPLYWWKEYDTYKIGTVANSCSTMHKIHSKEFTLDDFSHEHLKCENVGGDIHSGCLSVLKYMISVLNNMRVQYLATKNKFFWWQIIQLLPSSYNQKRTVKLNYQVLKSMYYARKNHKLDEWHTFCDWCETLPYFKEVCCND